MYGRYLILFDVTALRRPPAPPPPLRRTHVHVIQPKKF